MHGTPTGIRKAWTAFDKVASRVGQFGLYVSEKAFEAWAIINGFTTLPPFTFDPEQWKQQIDNPEISMNE